MSIPVLRRAVGVTVGGVLIGWLAFVATSWLPDRSGWIGIPECPHTVEAAGFDPWTGMGRGRLYVNCYYTGATDLWRDPAPRTWLGTRHAVPLWIGVPFGWVIAWVAVTVWTGRRSRD